MTAVDEGNIVEGSAGEADEGSVGLTEYRRIALQELLDSHAVVSAVTGSTPYIIVTERIGDGSGPGSIQIVDPDAGSVQLANPPNIGVDAGLAELGYASLSPWTSWTREEKLPELRDKLGIRQWYDMKRNDGTIRGSLLALKTPIRAAHWYIEPGEDTDRAKKVAEFVRVCLFEDMNVDFSQVLDDILLMFEYGYMVFEKVYKFRPNDEFGQMRVGLRKLAPRHPLDIMSWDWDDEGGPNGIRMEPMVPLRPNLSAQERVRSAEGIFIPINKLAIFSLEAEAGDLRGTSVLRSVYKHWYYKDTLYKIDAIQKERHGIGVPVIKLPPGYSPNDRRLADEIGRNLRTNEKSHIVLPGNWEIMFAKLEGQPVDCIKSIEHHNSEIRANVLAPFISDSNPDVESTDLFFKATRYLGSTIAAIFNKFIIRQLVDLNFPRGKYPVLRVRRIGEWEDLRTFSFAVRNFVGAGLIEGDDVLEARLREEADLPPKDFATRRQVATPQGAPGEGGDNPGDSNVPGQTGPSRAGPPRQSRPGANRQRGNSGRDNSGG